MSPRVASFRASDAAQELTKHRRSELPVNRLQVLADDPGLGELPPTRPEGLTVSLQLTHSDSFTDAAFVIVEFEADASSLRFERPVAHAGWLTCIHGGRELDPAQPLRVASDDQVSRKQIDLLPIVVHEDL